MRRKQRREKVARILAIAGFTIAFVVALIVCNQPTEITYAISDPNGEDLHYKYVTERQIDTVYIGNDTFLDENGNEWLFHNKMYKKGKEYTLRIHDNGTPNELRDDVITEVEEK